MTRVKPTILVVGSLNMDLVMQTARSPRAGESFIGREYSYLAGGKGSNQAVAAARLGASVTFTGRIGADAHGRSLKESLEREGIDNELLTVSSEHQTGFAAIIVEEDGQNRIIVYPGANMAIREQDVAAAFEGSYQAVMINMEISEEMIASVCWHARRKNLPVILDAGPAREYNLDLVRGAEIISPNEIEGEAITGIPCRDQKGAAVAAAKIAEMTGCPHVVIKMGEQGALYHGGGRTEHLPGYEVPAVDTTAAGDAFTAGLAVHFLEHGDMPAAVRYANGAGALAVTRLGAQPSLPTRAEVDAFIAAQH